MFLRKCLIRPSVLFCKRKIITGYKIEFKLRQIVA